LKYVTRLLYRTNETFSLVELPTATRTFWGSKVGAVVVGNDESH
jgi:hypothetical protein